MAIKQFTGNIGDLVEFHMIVMSEKTIPDFPLRWTVVGYVWESKPREVLLSNMGVIDTSGSVRSRSFWSDRFYGEDTYRVRLDSVDKYEILKPYLAK